MRFLVLGAGSLGSYFGAALIAGGADVTFLVRPRRAAQLAANGLVVKTLAAEIRCPARAVLAAGGTYDVTLLTCKTYDLAGAIEAVAPAIGDDGVVLPVLNGIDHVAVLGERFGRDRVLGGLSAVAAAISPQGEVVQLPGPPGNIVFGELSGGEPSPRCAALRDAFTRGGVPCTVSRDIMAEMWVKLFGFSAIAAVATLTRARAGEIAATRAAAGFVAAAVAECARIVAAEGYPPPAEMEEVIRHIFATRGSIYAPSILRDLEQGRRTEAEDTIGLLVRRAAMHGLPAPILTAALCNLEVHAPQHHP